MTQPHLLELKPSAAPLTGEVADELRTAYHALWGVPPVPERNPAPQPVSLERSHIPLLKQNPYVVADKSDGVRMCLFLSRAAGREHAVLVDRKLTMYQVPVAATKRCFDGTLFDGELLWTRTRSGGVPWQTFLVFDAVAWKGDVDIGRQPLARRLERIRLAFDLGAEEVVGADEAQKKAKEGKIICGGNAHGLSFRPKQCFPLEMLPTLMRQLPSLPYKTDGIILTPAEDPVRTGTHSTAFKLKWTHTLDFQANIIARTLSLGGGGAMPNDRLEVPGPDTVEDLVVPSSFWKSIREEMLPCDSPVCVIAECSIRLSAPSSSSPGGEEENNRHHLPTIHDDENGSSDEGNDKDNNIVAAPSCLSPLPLGRYSIHFECLRRDKTHPNSVYTAQRTLKSLDENLTIQELLVDLLGESAR